MDKNGYRKVIGQEITKVCNGNGSEACKHHADEVMRWVVKAMRSHPDMWGELQQTLNDNSSILKPYISIDLSSVIDARDLSPSMLFAYQGLKNELTEISKYTCRIGKSMPESMNLPDILDTKTLPTQLFNCITSANLLKGNLSSADNNFNAKLAEAFLTRFLSDAEHFNQSLTTQLIGEEGAFDAI